MTSTKGETIAKYRVTDGYYNYASYGESKRKFHIDSEKLFDIICEKHPSYVLIDILPKFFKLYLDINFSSTIYEKHQIDVSEDDRNRIFDIIIDVIKGNDITAECKEYIYADNNINNGLHIYFPEIVVDRNTAISLVKVIQMELVSNGYDKDLVNDIVSSKSYYVGMRMINQKVGKQFYSVNRRESTYMVPKKLIDQYRITCLKTEANDINVGVSLRIVKERNNIKDEETVDFF